MLVQTKELKLLNKLLLLKPDLSVGLFFSKDLNMDIFSGNKARDTKLTGKLFTLKEMDEGRDLRARFVEINYDGYYVFKITSTNTELDEFLTKTPNNGDVIK
jgi:hypothetical protein